MSFTTIPSTDVDAKSPIDDSLMTLVKTNLDDLDTRTTAAAAVPFQLEIAGRLTYISSHRRSIAMGMLSASFIPSVCRYNLKKSGTSGTLAFDIRKHTMPKTPITGVDHQYSAATSSIAQQGSALSTQSIARAATQISTQTITHAKAAQNVQSIILLGTVANLGASMVQYNLDAAISTDTAVGDSIVFASCTTGANNGTFVIVEKNRGGGNNVVVANASGVAQTGVAGTAQEKIMSYNFTNPVDSLFGAGYSHLFAAHSNAANDGTLTVYAINQSGNNMWVKNATGVTQGSAAGTADTNFWKFAMSSSVSTTDYIVGEAAKTASHSSGGNNSGALTIVAVNSGGNNVVLHNAAGVAQGGAAGNVNTNRWKYTMASDPSSDVAAGYTVYGASHTNPLNDGLWTVKEVTSTVIIVYNTAGVAQGGSAGSLVTTRKKVKFSSDQSAVYTTNSYIEMQGLVDRLYNYHPYIAPFRVLQVNRGGGSNYNVVIDPANAAASQASPAGYVQVEMKSIFNTAPSLSVDVTSLEPNQHVVGTSTDLISTTIAAQTPLALYLTSVMSGDPRDLTVSIV